jgi:hypothetical protein
MRSPIITSLLVLVAMQVSAQSFSNQSAPFELIIKSHNSTLNGTALLSCHQGAAIEGLCVFIDPDFNITSPDITYYLNYSAQTAPDPVLGYTGTLVWSLPLGSSSSLSEPMSLDYDPTTNVASPTFYPGFELGYTYVGFDKENKMFIAQGVDDTVVPPVYNVKPIYRWNICQTLYSSYYYTTLNWIMGPHSAENPTCQKVDIIRVFV